MAKQAMAVPPSVHDWIATPAPLNTEKHGGRAIFSGDNSVLERWRPNDNSGDCVCYTAHSLPVGQVWQTTVLNTSSEWRLGLSVGVTATLPHSVPYDLPTIAAGSDEWYYRGNRLYHNQSSTEFPNIRSLYYLSVQQIVGLKISTNGQLHLFINGKHMDCVATGLPVNKPLWGAVDVCHSCAKIKSEILSDPNAILQVALRDGFIPHRDDVFLIHGPGGVGKSSLISMFLGEQRDLIRVSTAVAEEPLQVCPIREVSTSMFTADWERVDYDRLPRMVAHTSHQLLVNKGDPIVEKPKEKGKEVNVQGEDSRGKSLASRESQAFLSKSTKKKNRAFKLLSKLATIFQKPPPSLTTSLGEDPYNIPGLFATFQEEIHELMRESREVHDFLLAYTIHLLDSGGQPQFHELVAILLRGITGIVSVFKLSEYLAGHGKVAFFKEGICSHDPYQSHYTNEQVIRHNLQAIQSEVCRTGIEEMPNLAFVGTFLDEQDACTETPDQKDERLHAIITEILPEEMQQCIITNGGQVTFRVNARTPGRQDYEMVGRLREALMSRSRTKPKNLPLRWYAYKVFLRMLMQRLGRQILSLQECEFIGHKLGFDPPSLKAALNYLRQLHIISFYEVLPNVIFGSSQVILDKITELVTYNLELRKGEYAVGGAERKFLQQGIISLRLLKSQALSKHYTGDLFRAEDMLKVFVSRLILSEVGPDQYLVPSVLGVSKIYPSLQMAEGNICSSFILHFSKKSPMCGVYCCTTSSLMSDAGWKLLTEGGKVVQVARNSITFEIPLGFPGQLTFRDPLSSYLEVIVELPAIIAADHSATLYYDIRSAFFTAVRKAMKTLHYEVRIPELSFLCPEQSSRCSTRPHVATVDKAHSFLKCSHSPGKVCCALTSEQKKWLHNPDLDSKGSHRHKTTKKYSTASLPLSSERAGVYTHQLHPCIQQTEPHSSHDLQGETGSLKIHDPLHYQTVQEPSSQNSHYTSQSPHDVSEDHKSFQTTTSVHHTRQSIRDISEDHERNQSSLMTEEVAPQTNSSVGSQRQTSSRKRGTTAPPSSNTMGVAQPQSNASRQTNTAPNPAPTLSLDDLQEVRSKIYCAAVKWKGIGLCLGLSNDLLDIIAANNRDVDSCLTAMLSHWLKKAYDVVRYGEPSWQTLREAVRDKTGGNNPALANTLLSIRAITLV